MTAWLCIPHPGHSIQNINHDRLSYVTALFNKDHTLETLRSFAACTTDPGYCSCAMLSPSVAMTAAHCIQRGPNPGPPDPDLPHIYGVCFRSYRNQNYATHNDECFSCPSIPFYSLQASDSDIMLLKCDPNAQGVLPGDKYGFIDNWTAMDISEGRAVSSFWSNPVDADGQDGRTILYSWGEITDNRSTEWPPVSCDTGDVTEHWALWANLYSNPGDSGSIWVYQDFGFSTLSAPTSTTSEENYGRSSTPMGNVLWNDFDGDDFPWVEEYIDQYINPGPTHCTLPLRVHQMDENNDGMFDAITEIDDNLAPRDVYALNMDARHRRLMWKTYYDSPTFQWIWQKIPYWRSALFRPPTGWTGWNYFLRRTLPLTSNKKYHVRVEYEREDLSRNDLYLGVYFYGSGCTYPTFKTKYYNYSIDPVDPKMFTFEIDTTGCTGTTPFYFYVRDDIGVIVHRVTVQRKDATYPWNFETWDTREEWRKDSDDGHALITPDGYGGGWAAVAYGVAEKQWNEECMNRAIPLLPSSSYALVFWEKRKTYFGNPSYVLVRSKTAFSQGENNVLYQDFTTTSGGYGSHVYYFNTNDYHDYYVSFGQKYGGDYYVDYVWLIKN